MFSFYMKKLVSMLCVIILVISLSNKIWTVEERNLEIVAQSINKFSFDLYKKLKDKNKGKNLFYSPASISIALAMTYTGARGNTEKQMAKVLHFTLPQEHLYSTYSKLIENLKSNKDYELHIANALWLQKDYKYLPEFLNIMERYYKGGFNEVDYRTNPENARLKINNWVSKETKGKIKDILNPGDITTLTRLVLTNAIYFKGKWISEFNKQFTKDEDFYLINEKIIKVKMMFQENKFNYFENGELQLLELPYKGDKISMVIILPKNLQKLESIENTINEKKLQEWIKNAVNTKVKTYIPRFKFTQRYDLSTILKSIGMKDAFDGAKADFSGIDGRKDLYISKVIHKAFVEVNEEGTEASAATGVIMERTCIERTVTFKANHPFIFLIRDKNTGCILFMGKIINPNEE